MQNWKTTVAGAGIGITTAIVGVVNYHELTTRQLCIIGALALSQFLLGLWAQDRVKQD